MKAFVDASVLVAIIANESDAEQLGLEVAAASDPIWSAMSCWEAISGLHRSHGFAFERAQAEVEAFAKSRPFRLVDIGERERSEALESYRRYGRGSGHAAKLNMGDCFAYACTKTNDAVLLYKGDDFSKTDLA